MMTIEEFIHILSNLIVGLTLSVIGAIVIVWFIVWAIEKAFNHKEK